VKAVKSLTHFLLVLILVSSGSTRAGEPNTSIRPMGIEGCYCTVKAIALFDGPSCLDVLPRGNDASRLSVGLLAGTNTPDDPTMVQCRFSTVSLTGSRISVEGCEINGMVVSFSGKFVASDPFMNDYPDDMVVLEGRNVAVTSHGTEGFDELRFTYDSGY
jgi:hypothetical protein